LPPVGTAFVLKWIYHDPENGRVCLYFMFTDELGTDWIFYTVLHAWSGSSPGDRLVPALGRPRARLPLPRDRSRR
jgi:hypothetical protein